MFFFNESQLANGTALFKVKNGGAQLIGSWRPPITRQPFFHSLPLLCNFKINQKEGDMKYFQVIRDYSMYFYINVNFIYYIMIGNVPIVIAL